MEKIRELIVELKGKKYGLCTLDGENVVDHQYSHIIQFGNDTYALKRRHTYQLYDSHMKLLHPYKFFQISLITHNQYLVQYKNTFQRKVFGLISMEGHVIIKPKYHSLTIVPSSDPVWFLAEDRKGMRIAYDRQMNEIRKWPTTHYVEYLGEGYFLEQDTHWEKIPLDDPRNEKCGAVRGWNPSFSYTITDVHGIPIEIPVIDNHISEFRYGLTRVTTYDGFIFYNRNLESILPQPVYAGIFGSDGVLSIKIDEQSDWHYINEKGKRQFGRNFSNCQAFIDGYAWIEELDGWRGIIDTNGEHLIPCEYPLKEGFEDDYAIVSLYDSTYGIINKKGDILHRISNSYINLMHYHCFYDYVGSSFLGRLKHINGKTLMESTASIDVIKGKYGFCITNGTETLIIIKKGEVIKREVTQ